MRLTPAPDNTGPSPLVTNDPGGPIPEPNLPPELAAAAHNKKTPNADTSPTLAGTSTDGAAPSPSASAPETEKAVVRSLDYSLEVVSPEAPALIDAFTNACLLERLADMPVSTVTGLGQRLRSDLETAQEVLYAFGYYSGKVQGKINAVRNSENNDTNDDEGNTPSSYTVTVTFTPGPQYTVSSSPITVTEPWHLPHGDGSPTPRTQKGEPDKKPDGKRLPLRRRPPTTLVDVGLPNGAPALAGKVLDAVAAVREQFRDRGYPYAKVASTRYVVNHETHTLEANISIDSGPLVYIGDLTVKGGSSVTQHYLDALRTWRPGWAWNQTLVENYRDSLRQSGLFSAAEIKPAPEDDANGLRSVSLELTNAPERTLGGALKYDSDFGPGIQGYWEHRNVTGRGDRLRFEAPVWADLQEFLGTYRLPFFMRNDQDLIAKAGLRHEDTDAYELTSAAGSIGIERRFSRRWTGSLSAMAEGGTLKDPDKPESDYYMVGLPGNLAYNGANSLLDATKGFRVTLALAPYTGEYHKEFSALRSRLEAQAFLPVIGNDSLVLAFRGMYGLLSGVNAHDVPSSLRYYVGGGGSVRGYEYQSLGPRNSSRDPLGGSSAVEVSAEARVKFNETWGAVAFIDGGMAYEDKNPDFSEEMQWGAGVGLRFYTAIGPVRLDVATPLNPRKKDDSVQIYFSIGQSF